jgi:hypothetical protein
VTLNPPRFIALTRGLLLADPQRRSAHADEVIDVRTQLDPEQQRCLAFVLAELVLSETDGHAREAQLHALADLDEWDAVPLGAIDLVHLIDTSTLVGSEIEYVEYLTRDRDA